MMKLAVDRDFDCMQLMVRTIGKGQWLEMIRHLNKESGAGWLICYKVLKEYHYDEQKALAYLKSGTWKCDIVFLIRH